MDAMNAMPMLIPLSDLGGLVDRGFGADQLGRSDVDRGPTVGVRPTGVWHSRPARVWTQFVGRDAPFGGALDGRTAVLRDGSNPAAPLPDKLRLTPDRQRDGRLPAVPCVDILCELHSLMLSAPLYEVKRHACGVF